MFGFLYRNYYEDRWLFFNGDPNNLRYTYDPVEAQQWWDKWGQYARTTTIKRPPNRLVDISYCEAPENLREGSKAFYEYLRGIRTEMKLMNVLQQFLDDYDVNADGTFWRRVAVEKVDDLSNMSKLQNMRDVLDGLFRTEPIKILTSHDKKTWQKTFADWGDMIGDVMNMKYTVGEQQFTTNLFGIYTPSLREAISPDSNFNGHTLQWWQRDVKLRRGRITCVIAPRSAGKTLLLSLFNVEYSTKGINLWHEKASSNRPFDIHYFGLSKDANRVVRGYILNMMSRLIKHKGVCRYSPSDDMVIFTDWDHERRIIFKSQYSEGVGRWERPHVVVIDEAARMDYEVYKTALGTEEAQIFCISTINYESRKNRFYDLYLEAIKEQRDYMPIDKLIYYLWHKYGLDKAKSSADINKMVKQWVFDKTREELNQLRPLVGMKYTIDDVEILTPEQKQRRIKNALMVGEDYCLAEYYGEYPDGTTEFNYEGLVEVHLPGMYDKVVFGFDDWWSQDNPALVGLGIKDWRAYVFMSRILNSDPIQKWVELKNVIKDYERFTMEGRIHMVADTSGNNNRHYETIMEKIGYLDMGVYYTRGEHANAHGIQHTVGKKFLVQMCKDEFFRKGNVLFSADLWWEKWLFEELTNFKLQENLKFQSAWRKKDDQVNAMMIAMYYARYTELKYVNFDSERFMGAKWRESKIRLIQMEREYEAKKWDIEETLNTIYADFW